MVHKIDIRLYSRRVTVPIDKIRIPKEFGTPKLEKIIRYCEKSYIDRDDCPPILTDHSLTLIDGYIPLLMLKARGITKATVYRIKPHVSVQKERDA